MRILALLTPAPGTAPSGFGPHVVAGEPAVRSASEAGVIRELCVQTEPLTASPVFEARDHGAVGATPATFPMVAAGLLDTRLVTSGPWTIFEAPFDGARRA